MSDSIQLPRDAEFVIIGAGIIGLFTGLNLARAGKEVVILDQNEFWHEASAVNAGGLAIQNKRLPLVSLAIEAIAVWKNLSSELGDDIEFVQCGGLRIATASEEVEPLRKSVDQQRALGVESEWVEGQALRALAPWIGSDVHAASFCAAEGFANPLLTGYVLKKAFSKVGGKIICGAKVSGIAVHNGAIQLSTADGSLFCRTLLIAAGAWSGEVTHLLGLNPPIHIEVLMVTVTEPFVRVMDRLVTHIKGILSVKQASNGTCIIGGGWLGRGDLASGCKELDYENLLHNLRLASRVVPNLVNVNIVRSWTGYEGVTPDSLPIFGRLPGYENIFINTCARGGYTVGPVLGKLMAELILTGETHLSVSNFDPRRFLK